jgi:hypothetical protein
MIDIKHPATCPAPGLRIRNSKLISLRYGSSIALRAKVTAGAEKHHELGRSDNWRNSRAPSQDRGFFHGEHEIAQRGSSMAGRAGTPERVCRFQLPVDQPRTVCHPHLVVREAGSKPVQLEPIMAKTLALGASAQAVPSQSLDAIARHQHISNAISTAQWHLAHGRINEATGRIMSAARHLKQLCTESTIGGRA